jgi:hypothetical protein
MGFRFLKVLSQSLTTDALCVHKLVTDACRRKNRPDWSAIQCLLSEVEPQRPLGAPISLLAQTFLGKLRQSKNFHRHHGFP